MHRTAQFLMVAIISGSLSLAVADPHWTFLTDAQLPQAGKAYVDIASIHEENGLRTVSSRLVLDLPRMSIRRMVIKEYREQLLVNCTDSTLGLGRLVFLDESGREVGFKEKSAENRRFGPPPAGSHHQPLISFVCAQKLQRHTDAASPSSSKREHAGAASGL